MRPRNITLPQLGLIAGTRVALGAGLGFLLADWLSADQRRAAGWTLLAVGVATTFPLAAEVIFRHNLSEPEPSHSSGWSFHPFTNDRREAVHQ